MPLYLIEPSWYDSEIPGDVFGSVEKVDGVRSAPLGAKI
jgi:hypothetical protein